MRKTSSIQETDQEKEDISEEECQLTKTTTMEMKEMKETGKGVVQMMRAPFAT